MYEQANDELPLGFEQTLVTKTIDNTDPRGCGGQLGVFTTRPIPAKSVVGRYTGILCHQDEIALYTGIGTEDDWHHYSYRFTDTDLYISGVDKSREFGSICKYINDAHGLPDTDNNVEFVEVWTGDLPCLFVVAKVDLAAHTELLLDYGSAFWENFSAKRVAELNEMRSLFQPPLFAPPDLHSSSNEMEAEKQVREQCKLLEDKWVHVTEAIAKFGDMTSKSAYDFWVDYKNANPDRILERIHRIESSGWEYMKMRPTLEVLATLPTKFGINLDRALAEKREARNETRQRGRRKKQKETEDGAYVARIKKEAIVLAPRPHLKRKLQTCSVDGCNNPCGDDTMSMCKTCFIEAQDAQASANKSVKRRKRILQSKQEEEEEEEQVAEPNEDRKEFDVDELGCRTRVEIVNKEGNLDYEAMKRALDAVYQRASQQLDKEHAEFKAEKERKEAERKEQAEKKAREEAERKAMQFAQLVADPNLHLPFAGDNKAVNDQFMEQLRTMRQLLLQSVDSKLQAA